MLGDSHISLRKSILSQFYSFCQKCRKKSIRERLQIFRFFCSCMSKVFFVCKQARLIEIFLLDIHSCVELSALCLPDLNFTKDFFFLFPIVVSQLRLKITKTPENA